MDKRYVLILFIMAACFVNLYFIASNSDVVGTASVECGKYICSIPEGFTLYETQKDHVVCIDDDGMQIYIYPSIPKKDNISSKTDQVISSGDYHILSNGTIKYGNIDIQSIYYQGNNQGQNRSTFYFSKDNASFRILITDFDYNTQRNKTIDIVTKIIDSIHLNIKKY